MILHIANLGNPILRKTAREVSEEEIEKPPFQAFLDDLIDSLQFHEGVGLAAPQVFRSQRVIAVWVPKDMDDAGVGVDASVYINPKLEPLSDEMEEDWEGCLSLKDLRGVVSRYQHVKLTALDRGGSPIEQDLSGFVARVFQHEIDHLDGVVFVDRMEDTSTLMFLAELERYALAE